MFVVSPVRLESHLSALEFERCTVTLCHLCGILIVVVLHLSSAAPPSEIKVDGKYTVIRIEQRSASPSPISSSTVHAHGLRPSASFHSQSQERIGYSEHVRSPSGKSGRAQVFGMPSSLSVESFGGNWVGMGSSSSE
jgi:hypothetical protein